MKINYNRKVLLWSIIVGLSFLTIGCSDKNRTIELSFQLNNAESFVPSDQMVVWMEQSDRSFVKTLYISEYLAYGGITLNFVCPDWFGRSNWRGNFKRGI